VTGGATTAAGDVVRTPRDAAALDREPLVVIEPLEAFLDDASLGGARWIWPRSATGTPT
jgi:hypothetical protein